MTELELEAIIARMHEFDPSDKYHAADTHEPGYYSAIARVERLLRGEIADWQSPR